MFLPVQKEKGKVVGEFADDNERPMNQLIDSSSNMASSEAHQLSY